MTKNIFLTNSREFSNSPLSLLRWLLSFDFQKKKKKKYVFNTGSANECLSFDKNRNWTLIPQKVIHLLLVVSSQDFSVKIEENSNFSHWRPQKHIDMTRETRGEGFTMNNKRLWPIIWFENLLANKFLDFWYFAL